MSEPRFVQMQDDEDRDIFPYAKMEGTYDNDGNRLDNVIDELNSSLNIQQKTLSSGSTSIVFEDSRINENTIFSFYTSVWGTNPDTITVGSGTVTLTFDAQDSDMVVGVKIDG